MNGEAESVVGDLKPELSRSPEEKYFLEGLASLWHDDAENAFPLLRRAANRFHAPSLFLLSLFLENPQWGFVSDGEVINRLVNQVEATNLKNQSRNNTNGSLDQWEMVCGFISNKMMMKRGTANVDPSALNNLGWIELCKHSYFESTQITASWEWEEAEDDEGAPEKSNCLKRIFCEPDHSGDPHKLYTLRTLRQRKAKGPGRGRARSNATPPDTQKAFALFEAASNDNLASAIANLGFLYEVFNLLHNFVY